MGYQVVTCFLCYSYIIDGSFDIVLSSDMQEPRPHQPKPRDYEKVQCLNLNEKHLKTEKIPVSFLKRN